MDFIIRILAVSVNNAFSGDIVAVYPIENLISFKKHLDSLFLIVRNTPFISITEFENNYLINISDVSLNPDFPIQEIRRFRYSIDQINLPQIIFTDGYAEIDWSLLIIKDNI